ncbi:HAD family hydrolase [Halobaculum lipolyticum]|uniref:HAD family hydrolase n=1 Tax=Halobaculum lipolyticum TaxID=3032001 RepID=A0ABD5WFU1_9EURY|nr:HAD family hydrolase [Halobaculum sp. DT31]
MTAGRYSAVAFDLDDTVCRRDQDPGELYERAFERAGVEPFGEPADLWHALAGPPEPNDERAYFAAGFTVVAARNDRSETDADALADGLLNSIDHGAVSFTPGAREALAAARATGPVALVTNGPEWRQSHKVAALDLSDAFDAVVYAGDMERRKPHPDPFDRACDLLGSEHAETLYVGDSLEHDVAGAQGAGLPVAWVPGPDAEHPTTDDGRPDPAPYGPEHVLSSLEEFPSLVRGR